MPIQRLVIKLAMAVAAGGVLHSVPAATQVSATKEKAALVRITQGPEIERADPEFAIVRWTSNNPGGSPEHYGVVRYGSHKTRSDGEITNQVKPRTFVHGLPRAFGRAQARDNLLLQG